MPNDPQHALKTFEKKHDFLICIDSDGCAFDTMEIKHKECFIPNIIKHWDLQPVSKYARAAAEFVNLYSQWRGTNRFPALTMTLDLLRGWPDAQRRGASIPQADSLREWIKRESKLGNPALKAEVQKTHDPVLARALCWSEGVNASIADLVQNVPPFPFVRESLEKISRWADVIVCSATPGEALIREWNQHGIDKQVAVIAGQEMGSKREHIALANSGRYAKDRVLMIGDAPGDLNAARANGALFFPVKPGSEDSSWKLFFEEVAGRFLQGTYTREYEAALVTEFEELLPTKPPWISATATHA